MAELNAVVAVYRTHVEAEDAVKELQRAGIDMRTLSIVGKDPTPMNTSRVRPMCGSLKPEKQSTTALEGKHNAN